MTPQETARMMTYLAATCAPVPEGDDWCAALEAWSDVFADVPLADMQIACRMHVKDTTPGPDGRPKGGWWPRPADLLARLRPAELTNEAAWAILAPILHRAIDPSEVADLTPTQRSALSGLPSAWTRAHMSIGEVAALRRPFLAGCQAAEARLKSGTAATVTAFPRPAEAPRLGVDNTIPDLAEQARRAENRQRFADLLKPPVKAPRVAIDERELRERAEEKAAQVRARFGGGR